MSNDSRFFTNEPDASLLDRFLQTLTHVQYFDVLVGYFRTSGFYLLQDAFEGIDKIRILIGLNVDVKTFEVLEKHRGQIHLDETSHKETQDIFEKNVSQELAQSEDTFEIEQGIKKFLELLNSGKLEIKAHPSQAIHAKIYISRFFEDDRDFGRVITGSSNFSRSGFKAQREFNVELTQGTDVKFALAQFEELWLEGVDVSQGYVDTIRRNTWLNDDISPHDLYLKFLYEYFKEDINVDQELSDIYFPDGFKDLEYQKQAVISAKKILEAYGGVFLADVVGLGKTFISALLAQQLPGRKLVICPPLLIEYWRTTFQHFSVGNVHVESIGKLDTILDSRFTDYDYIFIDEAHRFRNEGTQSYEKLYEICWGRKVILVSATPFNNTIADIYSQLKLFQVPRKSIIPGVRNLKAFFQEREKELKGYDKGTTEYVDAVKRIAKEVREKVLKYVMVRRTRTEIVRYFKDDIETQGLFFPEIAPPHPIVYELDDKLDEIFTKTVNSLVIFKYSRYMPLRYSKKPLSAFQETQQRNVGRFMKTLLVKRLESSYFAFKNTIRRFIESYQGFIEMYENGAVYISKDVNVFDYLDADREDELMELIREGKGSKISTEDFVPEFKKDLEHDLAILLEIQAMWAEVDEDPKLDAFIDELKTNEALKGNKVIIFTESSETGRHLYEHLNKVFKNKVMFYQSGGGIFKDESMSKGDARDAIEANYDPNIPKKKQKKDIRILISTDVLAEGINLHRSNVVTNYDLPWNPTRVLQRVGRVNRVGTEHELIHIFNFFPTAQSNEQIGLEENIKGKIQAFHNMLGEDARYLTEEEEPESFELFGDKLYKRLTRRETYAGEEPEETSELEFLQVIRKVRDDEPQLFEKVKRLPRKARSGRRSPYELDANQVVTFFRKGRLKKFFAASIDKAEELTFLDAVDLLRCVPSEPRYEIQQDYYQLLDYNKQTFEFTISPESETQAISRNSNEAKVVRILKSNEIKLFHGYTDDDEDFIKATIQALQDGRFGKRTVKILKEEIDALRGQVSNLDQFAYKVLNTLKRNIRAKTLFTQGVTPYDTDDQREIILSSYQVEGN